MSQITLLKSKIHRATVTRADLDYIGSLTLDEDLMHMVGIKAFEKVLVINISNNARYETYVIAGPAGSRCVEINGAAARAVLPGDKAIIMAWGLYTEPVEDHEPQVIVLDENNEIMDI